MLRIPLPYKVGEYTNPGNADEKLRTEAATYIWMRENCPAISVPSLLGFGFPGGQSFIELESAPMHMKFAWYLRRAIAALTRSTPSCPYASYRRSILMGHGYLILEYIETGEVRMLSETWSSCQNPELKRNLFKDISRIILTLSQTSLPCIGSWTIDDHGVLTLANRPLIHQFHSLENENIPTNIPRALTYTTTDAYYLDLLACHDSRIRHQPNSILSETDGEAQMANLFTMRGLLPHFTDRQFRIGPFVFSLTDLHGSNIFVDREWHIKFVIDLEWACAVPIQMLSPPYWLTNCAVDELEHENLQIFEEALRDFMNIFEEQEKLFYTAATLSPYKHATYRTDIIRRGWEIGNFWYLHALRSPKGLFNLFQQHVQPIFEDSLKINSRNFAQIVSPYWAAEARQIVAAKLKDKEKCDAQLRKLFEGDGYEQLKSTMNGVLLLTNRYR